MEEPCYFSETAQTDENSSFFESSCPGGQMFDSSDGSSMTNPILSEENTNDCSISEARSQNVLSGNRPTANRKRGPYKGYLTSDDVTLPRTTKWRRLQVLEQHQENNVDLNFSEVVPTVALRNILETGDGDVNSPDFDLFEYEDEQCDSNEEESDDDNDQYETADAGNCEQGEMDKPIYEGATVSIGECLLLLLSFILGNNLTGAAVANLLKLLSLILPSGSLLPKTKFLFDKYFNSFKNGMEYKFYCPVCKTLLDGVGEAYRCTICEVCYQKQQLLQKGNFFIYLPLGKQLHDLFQRNGDNLNLDHRFTRQKSADDAIEDIYDGQLYKTMAGGCLSSDPNCLSVSFNCDGVPIFKSSNYSIWPLQGILNELPQKQRKENVFLLGLWFGNGKPSMTSFLHPFTEEIKRLSNIGLDLRRGGVNICHKVFACVCSCDSVARCVLQNIHQFNGNFGCSWCHNPGETIEKGRGHSRVYVEGPESFDMRTHANMERHGRKAYRKNEPVCGVKGPTKLSHLPCFDIARGFVVDNLHCVDLGVTRQLSHLWFDSVNHQQQWYLGRHIQHIDARLKDIMPPNEVTRVPRSISQRAFWKGSEWHWWLLLYSPVILQGLLPSRYFKHLLLLVQGVYLLTKSSISRSDVNKANFCLSEFVRKFQDLYGKSHMTYNIHQLTHLTQTVIDWGPLPVYSSYIFEGFNLVLLRLFHGTQAVPRQIAGTFLLYKAAIAISKSETGNSTFSSFMEEQLTGHVPVKKAKQMGKGITFVGASYVRPLSIEEKYVVEEYFNDLDIEGDAEFFTKAIVNGNVLHSVNYRRKSRRKNYIVGTKTNITFELVVFANLSFFQGNVASIAFGRQIKLANALGIREEVHGPLCQHVMNIEETDCVLEIVDLTSIQDKFVLIQGENQQICCKLPNIVDRD